MLALVASEGGKDVGKLTLCPFFDNQELIMREFTIALSIVLLSGCSLLPTAQEESHVPVVYPAEFSASVRTGESEMIKAYGPSWKDVSEQYPEYRFNEKTVQR